MVVHLLSSGIVGLLILVTFTGVQCGNTVHRPDDSDYVLLITSDMSIELNGRFRDLGGFYLAHAYDFKSPQDSATKYRGILFKYPKGKIAELAGVAKEPRLQSNFHDEAMHEYYFIKKLSRLPSYFKPSVREVLERANERWGPNNQKDIPFNLLYSDKKELPERNELPKNKSGLELFSKYADKDHSVPKISPSKGQKKPRGK